MYQNYTNTMSIFRNGWSFWVKRNSRRHKGRYKITNRLIFGMAFWLISLWVQAQPNADKNFRELLENGQKARQEGNLPEALRNYLQVLPILKKYPKEQILIRLKIAELYQAWGVHQKSLPFIYSVYGNKNTKNLISASLQDSTLQLLALAHYEGKNHDSTTYYLHQKLKFEQENNLRTKIPTSLQFLIKVQKENQKFKLAVAPSLQLIQLFRQQKDSVGLGIALNNLGYLYKFLNQSDSALQAFNEVFDIEQKLRSKKESRIVTLVNIGVIYENQGNSEKSLAFLKAAQKLAFTYPKQLSKILNLIARVHLSTGDVTEAERIGLMAVQTARKAKLPDPLGKACLTLSSVYRMNFDYKTALDYFKEYTDLQDSLRRKEAHEKAQLEVQAGTAETLEKEIRLLLVDKEIKALQVEKFQLQAQKSEQEVALLKQTSALEKADFERQKLEGERQLQSLQLQQNAFEAERQARQIEDLEKNKKLQDLELREKEAREKKRLKELELLNVQKTKLEQEKKIQDLQLKEEEAQRRNLFIVIILGTSVFILLLLGFFRNRKQNRLLADKNNQIAQANNELQQRQEEILAQQVNLQQAYEEIRTKNDFLEEQKQTIEGKNQKITDSINYASRIQAAMLSREEDFHAFLPESFIFFRPRDIVSGDFYWFTKFDNYWVMAAMDCTGHGVPGAFMSMLSAQILQTLVHERELLEPAEILDAVHEEIRTALSQKTSKNRDGMDGTLVVICPDKKKLQFAGARNPLIMVKNGKVIRVKGDKLSIGGESHEGKRFKNHEFDIEKSTSFFMYSDGFQDQFGGPKGRKFMVKRFRELLARIASLDSSAQHQALATAFEDWKMDNQQVDDVLVIGFRM